MNTPRLVGVGAIFIDDIVQPDGTTYMAQLGGGVVHALMGAAVWDEQPGIAALAGYDLPVEIRQRLERHLDTRGLHVLDLPQIRAWQIFETDGTRRELFRVEVTEPFTRGAQPHHLPEIYRTSRGYYLLQDFDDIGRWAAELNGIIFWEPLQQIMRPGNHALLRSALQSKRIDVVSPNLLEAQNVYGLKPPEALAAALLDDGAQAAALRMGPEGSLIASRESSRCMRIPAVPASQIVDQTGAGNTYCGAMLAGLVQGKALEDAAYMGAVAASFCIEQRGVLDPGQISLTERDRRLAISRRLPAPGRV
jgi:sugar/nucleoside kinase (ribokinase family)